MANNIKGGKAITLVRKALKINKSEFAKRLRVSRSAVTRWEQGERHPLPDKCRQIKGMAAEVGLIVSLDELLAGSDNEDGIA